MRKRTSKHLLLRPILTLTRETSAVWLSHSRMPGCWAKSTAAPAHLAGMLPGWGKVKLQLLLAKWLRKREEGQGSDMNWHSQACEAFWAASAQGTTAHCAADAVLPIGTCCFSQRQVQRLPVPLGAEQTCILTCAKQTGPLLKPLPGASQHHVPSCVTQRGYHTVYPTPILAVHLSVALPVYLLGKHRENYFSHFCICYFPSWLPGKDVYHSFMGLGSPSQCCAHPYAQLLSWQCQNSPWGSLPNTTWPGPLTCSQITASKKQK